MKMLAARSMEEGAWGLVARFESGGPEQPEEVLEVAKVVAKYDGIYVTHIGSEGAEQDRELDFAIRVAQEAKLPVHIFHLKIRGEENWGTIGKYLAKIEAARGRGLDITANQYPYTAMQHGWSAFFPVWAREHGPQKFAAMLKDPATQGEDQSGQGLSDMGQRTRRLGWRRDGPRAAAAQQEVRRHAHPADSEAAWRRGPGRHVHRADGRRGRQHLGDVPHDVGGRRARGDEEAVGGDRQRRIGHEPRRRRACRIRAAFRPIRACSVTTFATSAC